MWRWRNQLLKAAESVQLANTMAEEENDLFKALCVTSY